MIQWDMSGGLCQNHEHKTKQDRIMKKGCQYVIFILSGLLTGLSAAAQQPSIVNSSAGPHVKMESTGLDAVKWTEGFWADRFDNCHRVMVPNMWDLLSDPSIMHARQNFLIAAGIEEGEHVGTNWIDGDTYKWLEAVAYVYAATRDEKLDQLMDEVTDLIGKAQEPDGYINTQMTIPGKKRFQNIRDHETYNMGHLMTAGCVHYRATGKTSLLGIARKAGDCLYDTFMHTGKHFIGYSSIMGLVELYRTTGEQKYLILANHFINMQGTGNVAYRRNHLNDGRGTDLKQDRVPLREETEAAGHSVRGNYLYCGATDVYSATGDKELLDALERIWRDVRYHKMYITGASTPIQRDVSRAGDKVHEAFGRKEYNLPNANAYNETCANVGSAMWNWRMLNVTGKACYADMAEWILYNSALSAIGLDGKHFFYTNVLRRREEIPPPRKATRWAHQMGFCCPPNIVRTIAKVHSWAYSVSDRAVWVNFYGGNILNTELPDGSRIELHQETDYPWDGKVKIKVGGPGKKRYAVMLRIPGWVNNPTCTVNGQLVEAKLQPGTYAELSRTWEPGDVIVLELPMPVRLIEANPKVEQCLNQVAVKRGPVVYCLESPDLPEGIRVSEVMIPAGIKFSPDYQGSFLSGVTVFRGEAFHCPEGDREQKLYMAAGAPHLESINIRLIPYYAWANRGISEMTVWMPVAY